MFALPVSRVSRPIAVLLGGSGRPRPTSRTSTLPALLKMRPPASRHATQRLEQREMGG
jgi:hypothetical protein